MSVSTNPGATALTVMPREKPRLRRRIVRLTRVSGESDDGGDIDDAPAPLLQHAPHAGLGEAKGRGEIGANHRIPVLDLHAQEERIARDGRVVHEDGRQPFGGLHILHQRLDRPRIARIEHGAPPLHARLRECAGEERRPGLARCRADDARARVTQGECNRAADAAGGAGHERKIILKHARLQR
jgi:hypothetical protein